MCRGVQDTKRLYYATFYQQNKNKHKTSRLQL